MAKKKPTAQKALKEPEPWDAEAKVSGGPLKGAPIVPEGYKWCSQCQAAYQGEQCPGCSEETPGRPKTVLGPTEGDPDPKLAHATIVPMTEGAEDQPERKPETCKEYLRCRLSAEERDFLGAKMAEAQMRITELKETKKAVMTQFASDIAAEEEIMNSLARRIFNGFEMRTVECQVIRDYEAKRVITSRMDTWEIVKQRDMKTEELQQGLDFEAPEPAAEASETPERVGDPPPSWAEEPPTTAPSEEV